MDENEGLYINLADMDIRLQELEKKITPKEDPEGEYKVYLNGPLGLGDTAQFKAWELVYYEPEEYTYNCDYYAYYYPPVVTGAIEAANIEYKVNEKTTGDETTYYCTKTGDEWTKTFSYYAFTNPAKFLGKTPIYGTLLFETSSIYEGTISDDDARISNIQPYINHNEEATCTRTRYKRIHTGKFVYTVLAPDSNTVSNTTEYRTVSSTGIPAKTRVKNLISYITRGGTDEEGDYETEEHDGEKWRRYYIGLNDVNPPSKSIPVNVLNKEFFSFVDSDVLEPDEYPVDVYNVENTVHRIDVFYYRMPGGKYRPVAEGTTVEEAIAPYSYGQTSLSEIKDPYATRLDGTTELGYVYQGYSVGEYTDNKVTEESCSNAGYAAMQDYYYAYSWSSITKWDHILNILTEKAADITDLGIGECPESTISRTEYTYLNHDYTTLNNTNILALFMKKGSNFNMLAYVNDYISYNNYYYVFPATNFYVNDALDSEISYYISTATASTSYSGKENMSTPGLRVSDVNNKTYGFIRRADMDTTGKMSGWYVLGKQKGTTTHSDLRNYQYSSLNKLNQAMAFYGTSLIEI